MGLIMGDDTRNKVLSNIQTRFSVRWFTDQEVSDYEVNSLLDAGFCAPSAKNSRPWHFIVIRDRETLKKISEASSYAKMVVRSNLTILICADSSKNPSEKHLVEDCSAAAQNILLAAHAMELGAVWCGINPKSDFYHTISELMELPEGIIPMMLIPIGYPDESRTQIERFEPKKVHKEKW